MSASGSGVVHRARGADELLLAVEPEPVLGQGRQVGVVDPASEVVPHMPCVNELVGAVARQEPSIFPFLTAVSKLLKLYEKDKFSFASVLRFGLVGQSA